VQRPATSACATQVTWTQLFRRDTAQSAHERGRRDLGDDLHLHSPIHVQHQPQADDLRRTDASGAVNDLWEFDVSGNVWRQPARTAARPWPCDADTADDGRRWCPSVHVRRLISGRRPIRCGHQPTVCCARPDEGRVGHPSIDTAAGMKITITADGVNSASFGTPPQGFLWTAASGGSSGPACPIRSVPGSWCLQRHWHRVRPAGREHLPASDANRACWSAIQRQRGWGRPAEDDRGLQMTEGRSSRPCTGPDFSLPTMHRWAPRRR